MMNLLKLNKIKNIQNFKKLDFKKLLTVNESESLQNEEWYRISKLWMEKMFEKQKMTKDEIDDQIKYLLPSALLFRDARPSLSPPKCVIHNTKDMFDKEGHVMSHGYFMNSPRFNDEILRRLHAIGGLPQTQSFGDLNQNFPDLYEGLDLTLQNNDTESFNEASNIDPNTGLDVRWVTINEFSNILGDKLTYPNQYQLFIKLIERLYNHEKSFLFMDFISKFMVPIKFQNSENSSLLINEDGSVLCSGYRKTAIAKVILKEGTGIITVNNIPYEDYFEYDLDKLQVLMPFDAIGKRCKFDVIANVINSGPASQAGAIRHAISNGLAIFSNEYKTILKDAGLLMRDLRLTERKKFGKHKARKSYKWVKR